jgi:hypothetical protein
MLSWYSYKQSGIKIASNLLTKKGSCMKYMLHIALLASTLAAHHCAQAAVKTQTVARTFSRNSRVMTRSALRAAKRSASLGKGEVVASPEGVPVNVEQLELAQAKPTANLDGLLDAQEVVSDRVITRSRAQALRARENRKEEQRSKDRVRAAVKKAAKARKN